MTRKPKVEKVADSPKPSSGSTPLIARQTSAIKSTAAEIATCGVWCRWCTAPIERWMNSKRPIENVRREAALMQARALAKTVISAAK